MQSKERPKKLYSKIHATPSFWILAAKNRRWNKHNLICWL